MSLPTQNNGRALPALARVALFVAAAGTLCLAARPDSRAADKDAPPKAAASHLDYVPADAAFILSFRLADYWDQPAFKAGREASRLGLPQAFQGFRAYFGVEPDEVDRMTFVSVANPKILSSYGPSLEPVIVVTTVQPYDRKAVLGEVKGFTVREVKVKDRTYFDTGRGPSYAFLDDHTFVVGAGNFLEPFLSRPEAAKDGPMAPVLKLAAEKHFVVAGQNVATIAKSLPPADKMPPDFKPFTPLLKAQFATLTVDLDEQVRADLKLTFANEADAKEGTAAVDDALDLARGGLVQMMKELNQGEDAPRMTALLKDVQTVLRAAKAEQKGATVEVAAALKLDPDATTAALAEAVVKVRTAAKRMEMSNDLKQLGIAMFSYHDITGRFPASAIYDKNGKALLSWRVLMLPYIEQGALYKEFHLDEPWDSDHNKKLLEKMPTTFAPRDSQAFKDHETFFQVFVGKGAAFEGKDGLRLPADFTDGTSNTIMIVEAAKSVPWTRPDDVPFDSGKLLPKVGGLSKGGFLAGLCDGSVRFFPLTIKEDNLRAWITRNAGDINEDPDK